MQNVGQQQLLMLLLVMNAQLDQRQYFGRERAGEQCLQLLVDGGAVGVHLRDGRTRQQATLGPRMARTDRFVVRVEEKVPALVIHTVARTMGAEHEGLEKPRRVREVPLGW